MPLVDVNALLGPEPERPPNTTDPAYKTYPQEKKKAWRDYITKKQQLKLEAWSMGYEPEDLGITGSKEQGQSYKRALEAFGMNSRNYEYDIASGRKRNVATSDVDSKERGNWEPMTQRDIEEYHRSKADGGNWRNTIARIRQDNGTGKIDQWARNNESRGAGIRRDSAGNLYDVGDDGQNIYYDAYGAQIDPRTGNRTGNIYGASRMQYAQPLGQASTGFNFGGVTGGAPKAPNPNAPAGPTVQNQPGYTYQPNANPWGVGGGSTGQNAGYRRPPTTGYYGRPQGSNQTQPSMYGGY
jgi:hypothetical protein